MTGTMRDPYSGLGLFSDGESFRLPELSTQLPLRVHPQAPVAEVVSGQWSRHHLAGAFDSATQLDRYLQRRSCTWGTYLAPRVSFEILVLLLEWTETLFVVDDLALDPATTAHLIDALQDLLDGKRAETGGTGPDEIVLAAVGNLWRRTTAALPPPLASRTRRSLRTYLESTRQEGSFRNVGTFPDFDAYLLGRTESVAIRFFMNLVEGGMGLIMDEDAYQEAERARMHALEHIALANDLLSFRKEHYAGDYMNAVGVMRANEDLSLQECIDRICSTIDACEAAFIETARALKRTTSHRAMNDYLRSWAWAIAGNQHWNHISTRYHGEHFQWNGLKSGTVTLTAELTLGPLP
jgi:hypothetical protein